MEEQQQDEPQVIERNMSRGGTKKKIAFWDTRRVVGKRDKCSKWTRSNRETGRLKEVMKGTEW